MVRAVGRLLLISIATLTLALFGLLLVRFIGHQQTISHHRHPLLADSSWTLVRLKTNTDSRSSCTLEHLYQLVQEQPRAVLFVDVAPDHGREWRLICPNTDPSHLAPLANPESPRLRDLLEHLSAQPILFNVHSQEIAAAQDFSAIMKTHHSSDKILISSPSRAVLRELRKLNPRWLFGCDPSSFTKYRLFANLHIETAADLWSDFFIVSGQKQNQMFLPTALAKELIRRRKHIIYDVAQEAHSPFPEISEQILTNRPTVP